MNKCNKNGIKREGESCTLNNNCIYPNCKIPTAESLLQAEDFYTYEESLEDGLQVALKLIK